MIGKVLPPNSYSEVVFFLVFNGGLEEICENSGEQSHQKEDDGYNQREERRQEGGEELHHDGNYHAANAHDPQIGYIFSDKGFSLADIHGDKPGHSESDEDRDADGIEHRDHNLMSIGRYLDSGIINIEINKPRESHINHNADKHNNADEKTSHVTQVEF